MDIRHEAPGTVPGCSETTDALARWVAGTTIDDLPPEVVDRTKRSILDHLGCAILGSRSESAAEFLTYVTHQGGPPESTVVCGARRLSAHNAAMINGTYAHATELFESFTRAMVHPGNVVIPAVLAVAERDRLSGADVVVATAVGFELLARVGLSVGVPWLIEQGFHTPSALGGFGSTAAVARAIGLEPTQTADALGIAACSVPSTLHAAMGGATIKELFEGTAAAIGVMAVDLSVCGITGVRDWDRHWYKAMARTSDPSQLTADLGAQWRIESGGLHYKLKAVMAVGQAVLDAMDTLLRENPVDPDRIHRVTLHGPRRIEIGGSRRPDTYLAAIASSPFLAAFALIHQADFLDDPHFIRCLTPERMRDPRVLALAERVEVVVDEQIDRDFEFGSPQKFAARVEVETAGGETVARYSDIWPLTSDMTFEDVARKFHGVVRDLLVPHAAKRIVDDVARITEIDDISALLAELGEPALPGPCRETR